MQPISNIDAKAALPDALARLHGVEKLLAVVAALRHPAYGCPWDLKQTHASLKPYLLEEAYEAVEAVDAAAVAQNPAILKDELGDVLLQVALHAQLAREAGDFDFAAVAEAISDKLIRRHPHVFADAQADDADTVVANWQEIKRREKGDGAAQSILDGVPHGRPALSRALETSKRAVKVGFTWPSFDALWACVMSEFDELRAEVATEPPDASRLEDELGDILFACVNLARHLKVDPETALSGATAKFTRRFQAMEREIVARGLAFEALDFDTWDALWRAAKQGG